MIVALWIDIWNIYKYSHPAIWALFGVISHRILLLLQLHILTLPASAAPRSRALGNTMFPTFPIPQPQLPALPKGMEAAGAHHSPRRSATLVKRHVGTVGTAQRIPLKVRFKCKNTHHWLVTFEWCFVDRRASLLGLLVCRVSPHQVKFMWWPG